MPLTAVPAIRSETRVLGGITVADTPLISRAIEYARTHSELFLFNHAVRSWLYAVRLGQRRIPALLVAAPKQTEMPFVLTQLRVLALFGWLGFAAFRRFRPQAVVTARQATAPAAAVAR